MTSFLRTPAQRICAVILGISLCALLLDFVVFVAPYAYALSKYTSYYLDCITGADLRDVCRERREYSRVLVVVSGLAFLGLYWDKTYGRIIVVAKRFVNWVQTGT